MLQLLREWPPGYGGVERVAHCLALAGGSGDTTFSLTPAPPAADPLPVPYRRVLLPALPLGRLLLALPSKALFQLLAGREPLLGHLPCPTVLLLVLVARLLRPRRHIYIYWHAFIEPRPTIAGWLEAVYQALALALLRFFPVLTTSPPLRHQLIQSGLPVAQVTCLPCCLPPPIEAACNQIHQCRLQQPEARPLGRLISIGRLDSYKRIDWLLQAIAFAPAVGQLDLVGDGPLRGRFEALASELGLSQRVVFHGRLAEQAKLDLLSTADLLVLPADRCNEAFGIVQLEAMASGIPSLAFDLPRSGMFWVSNLPALGWSGRPSELAATIQQLLSDAPRHRLACHQARRRYDQYFAYPIWRRRQTQIFCTDG
ncbi:glycosyltransferase [Cyanobium sp. WAJ14-Wanaka]|uniref:glycosyltransferase n=1 Tax=Cyanobium sp. WAJ14-Wanaka TaxID=2823725 RepID=UPI0020CBF785|nr:glycosyltransferase [Cyanobium sp. WAJ14-Wanaka]MCP9775696.1 glycosyltransferase [Cyanobium sp. WAJ14-Wanaka]